jgi:peptide subunit release factor 1 (eRF1)
MIRHRDVEQLQQLSQAPGQTLTVYLDVDQTNAANRRRQFETRLKDLLKQLKAAHRDDKELAATCSEVEEITKSIKPSGRTLVLARHRKLGVTFRNVIRIAMPSGVYWTNGAFLRPLLEALDENERYGIVLVDQKRARLFTVFMGEIEEHKDLVSQIPPRPESPSADKLRSQPRMQRRHDESVSSHVRFVAREFGKLMEQLEVDRLIVGGNVGVASELAGALPKRLRGRLVEVLPIPVAATPEEILTRAAGVQTRLERAEELEVVREILKEVRKGGRAVAGLSATLDAINEGRVWKLVYLQGLKLDGGVCNTCNMLFDPADDRCPVCTKKIEPEPHMVDRMARTVLERGGHVEMVDGPAAEALRAVAEVAALMHS